PVLANYIVELCERLSYRQFCLLSIAGRQETLPIYNLLPFPNTEDAAIESLRLEILDMLGKVFDTQDIKYDEHIFPLTSVGKMLYELLELNQIPAEDNQMIKDYLMTFQAERSARWGVNEGSQQKPTI
ncbi:MAG: hypothetical protein JOZ57_07145, partial [Abitibacteriaceae bacterium]|nr:hypothetical protein [Abditibacteriaceae bacterium]